MGIRNRSSGRSAGVATSPMADSIAAEVAALDDRYKAGMLLEEADEAFPANVGPLCGWCDFNRVCEVGRAAVPLRDPWTAVVTD